MISLARFLLAAAIWLLPVLHVPTPHASNPGLVLSARDRQVVLHATRVAGKDTSAALRWLQVQSQVASVTRVSGSETLLISFRDGARLAIVPAAHPATRPAMSLLHALNTARAQNTAPSTHALVLEPFADELQLGPTAGDQEAASLREAGFQVDVLRNAQVTVDVMASLAGYAVVYDETHAGVLSSAGDGIVVTGQVSASGPPTGEYAGLFADHSLLQATVAGDAKLTLYYAVTSTFFAQHVGHFPPSAIMFLNGCELLAAPVLWKSLEDQGVATLLSWDAKADVQQDELTGGYVTHLLAQGSTVSQSVAVNALNGYGSSYADNKVAHFGYLGDGDNTLQRALSGLPSNPSPTETPTPVPTATATDVPSPTALPVKKKAKCKAGHHRSHGRCVKTKAKHH